MVTHHRLFRALLKLQAAVVLIVFFSFSGCDEDNAAPASENTYVNDWILEKMDFWYLWDSKLPSGPDKSQAPDAFFKSLLYKTEDRFSWIQDNYNDLLNSLEGVNKEAGYEFVLYREQEGSNNVVAQIMYIKPNSPAQTAGLKRGDLISHINDQQLTVDNYKTLLKAISEPHTLRYKPLLVEEKKFEAEKSVSLTTLEYSENPNYFNKVITVDDKKIGYYVYNFFASGTGNATTYDDQMDAIFQNFKAQGINNLVLDLRFNSGGSEVSATNLASLIAPNVNSTKVFFKKEYNPEVKQAILGDPDLGQDYLLRKFNNESANIGSQLENARVYVLASSRTASASELIINGLRPYMEVHIIGDTTYGKNVGSISLYEKNDAKNKWGMQPIIMKAFNSLSQSEYTNGFVPNTIKPDNGLYIYPLGDERERLLSEAIAHITGTTTSGREAEPGELKRVVGHSLDFKQRSFNLVIEDEGLAEKIKEE